MELSRSPDPLPLRAARLERRRGVIYGARPVRPETSEVLRAWRLRKADGTTHDIAETIDGITCDCGDLVFRHDVNRHARPRPLP